MFTNISWNNYIVVIVLLAAGWYLIVGFRFYLSEVKEIVSGKRKLNLHGLNQENYQEFESELNHQYLTADTSSESSFGEFDKTFDDVDTLIEKLKNAITEAVTQKPLKQEFANHLKLILAQYPLIKNSPFSISVSELIVSECSKLEYSILSQSEAEALWN